MTATTMPIARSPLTATGRATATDAKDLAPLWQAFAAERESIDPSMLVKPNFEFEKYVIN
ncbi:MAG: hypothetical protein EAZ39_13895 [Oscillatoriales cyanobacterium]|uniref:hypothetical protein n=1 Tax=unclassified Microcoleus TaxID=2642155 RepID=UPI001D4627E6|nr:MULTISPECIES: hypothetical protein [unclassified Microcoleus]TAG17362.1 MAG: hypothetical protein EAZ39_13895 [Oscillatoriales cyanobacterium]MCC3433940.1 hypothetical protein [Microcoleus sp. PH2017_05_CCC_O_A]MCC3582995.1 hypothetical protein [Microcoleus sp. PH2017_30_WIL_O_A]TAG45470.1 MAG: hypothetical protein EAZ33_07285 [Oscillatoriales cyanobacterium]TAG60608.1 MAG: hypothetical protein EAZ28_06550 [Oscillatoriales cyanobacterium]